VLHSSIKAVSFCSEPLLSHIIHFSGAFSAIFSVEHLFNLTFFSNLIKAGRFLDKSDSNFPRDFFDFRLLLSRYFFFEVRVKVIA
jgi:hypothetical protein